MLLVHAHLPPWWREGLIRVMSLYLLNLVMRWWWWSWKVRLLRLLNKLLHVNKMSTVFEQMTRLLLVILGVDICM
jgi:hypothetical protein